MDSQFLFARVWATGFYSAFDNYRYGSYYSTLFVSAGQGRDVEFLHLQQCFHDPF